MTVAFILAFSNSISEPQRNDEMAGQPRVDIDRPKPTYMLHERDKRVHGLKPFQDLVDKAAAGSILKPPPGIYSGPVVINKPLIIEGAGKVTIDA